MFENNIIWILLVGLVGIWISLDFIQALFSSIKEGKEEGGTGTGTRTGRGSRRKTFF